jgi:two-component system NarL family sensor kinase
MPTPRELRILNAIAEALNSAPDVQQALERALALVADLLGLQTGWVWLLDAESGQFYNAAVQNLPPYLQEPIRMAGGACYCIDAFREGRLTPENIRLINCSRLEPAVEANDTSATRGLSCHASIPLSFQGKPLGIMNVTAPSWRELTPDELRLLSTIAYQVGIAIERARLAEESARLARAEERARIAREIHDTLAQGLTAIALHVEGAMRHLETHPGRARERLERALAMARESLEDARRSVLALRVTPLAGKPLPEVLGALGRAFTSETGIRVHFVAHGCLFCGSDLKCEPHHPLVPSRRDPRASAASAGTRSGHHALPLRVEAELFRIAQESLANVRRHARATRVTLVLQAVRPSSEKPERVRLFIHDDGQGFDPRKVAEGSQGVVGMRERAQLLGGTLRVRSRPGRGTLVTAEVPLPQEADA